MSTLIVIAKSPVPGRVKTRLCPPFTHEQAARLAEAALADTLHAVLAAPADRRLLVLDGEPGPWLPEGFTVVPQVAGTLDVRLAAAFAAAARFGSGPAVLIGMDTPQADPDLLAEAVAVLTGKTGAARRDAAFGPAEDGGFWLLGLREPGHPRTRALLTGVPMSRPDTGAVQRARLITAGLSVADLPALLDVDTAADARAVAARIPGSRFAACLAEVDTACPAGVDTASPTAASAGRAWEGQQASGYEQALWLSLSCPPPPVDLHGHDGTVVSLNVARYAAPTDAADATVMDRCTGPTLDIGCGPGRLATELARRGVPSLGVDVNPVALLLARATGASTLRRSVFDRLPGEGRWPHALLIDGNIGIGGDPATLLGRVKTLLKPGGELIVETAEHDGDERLLLSAPGQLVPIPWARLGAAALRSTAEPLGYRLTHQWTVARRRFAALTG